MGKVFTPGKSDFGKVDATVIGGGIVGVATAFWLSRAGLEVVLVEMRDGLSTLTTPASAECFRAQFAEPAMAELAIPSIEMFENFHNVIGVPGYGISIKQQGYFFVTDNPDTVDDLKQNVEQQHLLGVTDTEFLERDEIIARFPFISPSVLAATFRQRDGWLSCHETTQGFAKGCDARFFINTRTTGIQMDEKGVRGVETDRGVLQTRTAVNAAGPFAAEIGRMVDLDLPLEPVRRQKVYIKTSAGFYMYTPDDQPLIGSVPEVGGFYVNCGYWSGVMLSPQAGKRIADLVTGKMKPGENPLRPTRFKEGLGKKGKTLMSH